MLSGSGVDDLLEGLLPRPVWQRYELLGLGAAVARYVELLVRWNGIVSLTSLRRPEEIVRRHVAESLCCAVALPVCDRVLDLGSGGGFPGVPVQLMQPEIRVTLAESHGRKAAFLREVVRELGLRCEVFGGRAQELEAGRFECVCLRAVDPMGQALEAAAAASSRWICVIGAGLRAGEYDSLLPGWRGEKRCALLDGGGSVLFTYGRAADVPRGT